MAEIFSTQDQIVQPVLRALDRPTKIPTPQTGKSRSLPCLRARTLRTLRSTAGDRQARELLELIVAKDPEFAAAHVELATIFDRGNDGPLPPSETSAAVRRHTTAALRADPANALARSKLCRLLISYDWDWNGGERECREATRLSPGSTDAHTDLVRRGACYTRQARWSQRTGVRRKARPALASSDPALISRAVLHAKVRRERSRGRAHLHPEIATQSIFEALSLLAVRSYSAALEAANRGVALNKQTENIGWLSLVGSIHAASDGRARARDLLKTLKALESRQRVSPMLCARIYACLGDAEPMFHHLERELADRDLLMPWLMVDARFDSDHNDGRFIELLRRLRR